MNCYFFAICGLWWVWDVDDLMAITTKSREPSLRFITHDTSLSISLWINLQLRLEHNVQQLCLFLHDFLGNEGLIKPLNRGWSVCPLTLIRMHCWSYASPRVNVWLLLPAVLCYVVCSVSDDTWIFAFRRLIQFIPFVIRHIW